MVVVVGAGALRAVHQLGWGGLLIWAAAVTGVAAAAAATGSAIAARRRSETAARVEIARRAVSEERLAMAQDVHDGVGHSLAVIAMQAGVAAHVLDRDPDRARELLASGRGDQPGGAGRAAGRPGTDAPAGRRRRPRGPAQGWPTCRCCWTGCATAGCGWT